MALMLTGTAERRLWERVFCTALDMFIRGFKEPCSGNTSHQDASWEADQAVLAYRERCARPRWVKLNCTSPSGKTLFVCRYCGRVSATPDKSCPTTLRGGEGGADALTCAKLDRDGIPASWRWLPIVSTFMTNQTTEQAVDAAVRYALQEAADRVLRALPELLRGTEPFTPRITNLILGKREEP
jgi:hypothetical protein